MNEASSRLLDRWVGVGLCWLLTRVRRLSAWLRAPRVEDEMPRKILFIKLAEMGAIVLLIPAWLAAARRVGRENLFIVVLEGNRQVHNLLGMALPENTLTIRDRNLFTFAIDAWRLMRFCRRQKIDTVIDLEGFARISAVLAFLTGAARRVGWHRYTSEGPYRGDLMTHRVSPNAYQHASQQFLTLVEALDRPVERRRAEEEPLVKARVEPWCGPLPYNEPTHDERRAAAEMVRRAAGGTLPSEPWIVLNPNLIDLLPLRRWPEERFRELGRIIVERHPTASVLLTGLPAERERSRRMANEISPSRAVSLAGETESLRALVALYTHCALLITSDCGPAHMAALTEMPIVSLFGPETPALYAPLSPHNRSLWAGLACSPCLTAFNHRSSPCRDNVCMQAIGVEQVWQAALAQCPELRGAVVGSSQ